jgi:secondary thiamine-phosphate synthase enzyme
MITTLTIHTTAKTAMMDVTVQVEQALRASGATAGICQVFVPHTTAGVTLNENADPDVQRDILTTLDRLVPARGDYRHGEGNSPAHVKASLMGASLTLPIQDGRLLLGRWQSITFCEFDGPRQRALVVNIVAAAP